MNKQDTEMVRICLEVADNYLDRAECSLIPDMEDTPTAADEVTRARWIIQTILKHF